MSVNKRLRSNINELLARRAPGVPRTTQRDIADRLQLSAGTISDRLHEPPRPKAGPFRLEDLDLVADLLGVDVAELVAPDDRVIQALNDEEQRWLDHFRNMPREPRLALLNLLDYFLTIAPREDWLRDDIRKLRTLPKEHREAVRHFINDRFDRWRGRHGTGAQTAAARLALEGLPRGKDVPVQTPRRPKRRASG